MRAVKVSVPANGSTCTLSSRRQASAAALQVSIEPLACFCRIPGWMGSMRGLGRMKGRATTSCTFAISMASTASVLAPPFVARSVSPSSSFARSAALHGHPLLIPASCNPAQARWWQRYDQLDTALSGVVCSAG